MAVCAHSPRCSVPDRKTGLAGVAELRLLGKRKWNFVAVDVLKSELDASKQHVRRLICPSNSVMDDSIGCAIWFAARGRGNIVADGCDGGAGQRGRSGARGADARAQRCLTDQHTRVRTLEADAAASKQATSVLGERMQHVKDRCAKLWEQSKWSRKANRKVKGGLSAPSLPRLAALGQKDATYETEARVLLLGMGADEQMAGYGRHRTRFTSGGWQGLIEEVS